VLLFQHQSRTCYAQSDYDEYLKEVLEENRDEYANDNYHQEEPLSSSSSSSSQQQQQEQQQQKQRQAEEEAARLARENADRIAAERERAFEKELAKMNADQQKAALQQKKKDANINQHVLKAAKNGNHYAVLGIRNWQLRIPPRAFNIGRYKLTIPGITIRHTTTKDIRRAYKRRALAVHPDKNRDGSAEKAFVAVENAASILSDDRQRAAYDEQIKQRNQARRDQAKRVMGGVTNSVGQYMGRVVWVFRSVFGPFATPVIVIGAILI
jgi:DnaJ domain